MATFNFVKLVVNDLDATIAFFETVFGAKVVASYPMPGKLEAVISISGGEPDLVLECPDVKPEFTLGTMYGQPGMFVEDVDALVAKIVNAGGSVIKEAYTHEESGIRFAFVALPEGHQIEILQNVGAKAA